MKIDKSIIVQEMMVEELLSQIESAIQTFLARHPDADFEKSSTIKNISETIYNRVNSEGIPLNRNRMILKKLEDRLSVGQLKYGQDIPINDGRDWLKEALEEVLDGLVYLTNYLIEIENKREDKNE
tara:strand:+ start:6303 stop:6680 length:378 start_codon:yes stop_codon:yes gene_type:complete